MGQKIVADKILSPQGAGFLRSLEGFVDHWYLDIAKVPTIGVGFTWASSAFRRWWEQHHPGKPFDKTATMTRPEADEVLALVMAEEYGAATNRFFTQAPGRNRDPKQHEFDATASVAYNLGPGALTWNWADALAVGDVALAADRLRATGLTARGSKKKIKGLVTRRKEEAELLVGGDYTIGKNVDTSPGVPDDGILERGERGAAVMELQRKLAGMGFYKGELDGKFGHGTEAAVLAFQRLQKLDDDGKVGPMTQAALEKATVTTTDTAQPPIVVSPGTEPVGNRNALFAAIAIAVGAIYGVLKAVGILP